MFRLVGSVPAVTQWLGWTDSVIGRSVIEALTPGFPALTRRALIPFSMGAYLGWRALMGIVLAAGATLALFRRRSGLWLMASYFLLFGVMFLNYLAFSTKIVHFAVGLVLFAVMLWLSKPRSVGDRRTGLP